LIDLAEFSNQGVNLTGIKKVMIGVGNRSNPIAGGSGQLFFDDIRVCGPSTAVPGNGGQYRHLYWRMFK
jgi:hypothetical protein